MPLSTGSLLSASSYYSQFGVIYRPGLQVWVDASQSLSYSGSGTTWYDLSGNSNNMTLISPTFSSAQSAIQFNGSSTYAITPNLFTPFNAVGFSFTQEVWFNSTNGSGVIIDELGSLTPDTLWHDSQLELVSNEGKARVWNSDGTQGIQLSYGSNSFNNSTWYHAAIRYNNATGNFSIFKNGTLVTSGTKARSNPPTDYYSALGVTDTTNLGSGAYFTGYMRIYRLYTSVLTDGQIVTNYNAEKTRFGYN